VYYLREDPFLDIYLSPFEHVAIPRVNWYIGNSGASGSAFGLIGWSSRGCLFKLKMPTRPDRQASSLVKLQSGELEVDFDAFSAYYRSKPI
jgi:hypothetical protein